VKLTGAVPWLLAAVGLFLLLQGGTTVTLWAIDRDKSAAARKLLPIVRRMPLAENTPTVLWFRESLRALLGLALLTCAMLTLRARPSSTRATLACCAAYGGAVILELCLFLLIEQPVLAELAGPGEGSQLRAITVTRFTTQLGTLLIPLLVVSILLRESDGSD